MTKCYAAWCNPFFESECLNKSTSHRNKLKAEKGRMVKVGIRFDKSKEDEEKYYSFLSSKVPNSKATGVSEWFTPLIYIEAARKVMGSITVDPASTDKANEIIKADMWYTQEDDGLKQEWKGHVWMNPPYSQPLVTQFCNLFVEKFKHGDFFEGCVLVNNATETTYFQNMLQHCTSACFVRGRVPFLDSEGNPGAPLQGQIVLYFGPNWVSFESVFSKFGVILHAKR